MSGEVHDPPEYEEPRMTAEAHLIGKQRDALLAEVEALRADREEARFTAATYLAELVEVRSRLADTEGKIQEIRDGRHAVNDALVWHKRRADAAEARLADTEADVQDTLRALVREVARGDTAEARVAALTEALTAIAACDVPERFNIGVDCGAHRARAVLSEVSG